MSACGEERFEHGETEAEAAGRIDGSSHGGLPATPDPGMIVCREESFEHDDLEAGAGFAQTNVVWYGDPLAYLGPAMSMNGGEEAGTAIVQMNAFSHGNPFATLGPPANTLSESADQFGADSSMSAECPFCWPVADAVFG